MTTNRRFSNLFAGRFTRSDRTHLASFGVPTVPRINERRPLVLRIVVVFALLVQQGAFIEMPALRELFSVNGAGNINSLNTIAVVISVVALSAPYFMIAAKIGPLASKNALFCLYIILALASSMWSVHPDLTNSPGTWLRVFDVNRSLSRDTI